MQCPAGRSLYLNRPVPHQVVSIILVQDASADKYVQCTATVSVLKRLIYLSAYMLWIALQRCKKVVIWHGLWGIRCGRAGWKHRVTHQLFRLRRDG